MQLIALAETAHGFRPVSDQFWIDLTSDSDGLIRVLINDTDLIAYAQAGNSDGDWTVEVVLLPTDRLRLKDITHAAISAIAEAVRQRGGTTLSWLVFAPEPAHTRIAAEFGLALTRQLYQMGRSLPTGLAFEVATRAFVPGEDEREWLRVNQRAFAWNPEQGGWTMQSLVSRMAEPWFDPQGFLLTERDGRLAGFCWTKVHASAKPVVGEIYVIAVDPDFHGIGLGRSLTLAGLDHLSSRGITRGMLFVDADNTSAVGLYETLGFTVHRTDCVYHGSIT